MSDTPWTPGPWEKDKRGNLRGSNGEQVGTWDSGIAWVSRTDEAEANAILIAAAPDLFHMLEVAQLWLEVDGRYDMQGINAALAKAKGATP